METTEAQISRLQLIRRRLRVIAKINIGLMVILVGCCVWSGVLLHALKDPDDPNVEHALQQFMSMNKFNLVFGAVCPLLMLVWGPALIICSYKLKKLKSVGTGRN
jgi:hypothetical protein